MPKKILNGIVISDKPDKTITVVVERKYQHPVLKKVIKAKKKYSVHDEENKFKNGDKVSIRECRPYSKSKRFEVIGDLKANGNSLFSLLAFEQKDLGEEFFVEIDSD